MTRKIWLSAMITLVLLAALPVRAADGEPVRWDTVTTHDNMFSPTLEPSGACVALAVSNHGGLGFIGGTSGGVNLDYAESGLECGARLTDFIYLAGSTAFAIIAANSAGLNAQLTQVINDPDASDVTGWDPVPDKTMSSGTRGTCLDSVYTGKFVNRDTTIAMERILYAPRSTHPETDTLNFVILLTRVYSADGAAHNHLTFGNVVDWDVPSDIPTLNRTGVSNRGFVYVQGTDTTNSTSCQSNLTRYATEAFGGSATLAQLNASACANDSTAYHSSNALIQTLIADTTHYRDGTPLSPSQPNPLVWWEETGVPGLNADPNEQNQAVWLTVKHDCNLAATDTLRYWTVLTTTQTAGSPEAGLAALEAQVAKAKRWVANAFLGCGSCCRGRVGDVNNDGADEPTIGDISMLIDALFITGNCDKIACLDEADVNQSAQGCRTECEDITIGDISLEIDCLFITGPDNYIRKACR